MNKMVERIEWRNLFIMRKVFKGRPCFQNPTYIDVFPCGSKGRRIAISPETRNMVPAIQMGTELAKLAYNAMIGPFGICTASSAYYFSKVVMAQLLTKMPKMRFPIAVRPFPVPLSLVGNSSGEMAYNTP